MLHRRFAVHKEIHRDGITTKPVLKRSRATVPPHMRAETTPLRQRLGKFAVATGVFATILGGWAWAKPLITYRLPLPDVVNTPGDDCVVWLVGSSSIHNWRSVSHDLPGWRLHNRGIGGALLDQIDSRLRATDSVTPPVAIIAYAGENDIQAGATGTQAAEAMARVFRHARFAWPKTPFFVIALKPSPVRWHQRPEQLKYNARASTLAQRQPGVTYLPAGDALMKDGRPDPTLFVDGVHMNDRGYGVWSQSVRAGFEAAMPAAIRRACARRTAG